MRKTWLLTGILASGTAIAQIQSANLPVHDPVMIRQDSSYYLFATGRGINVWSSSDRISWKKEAPVFDTLPWGVKTVPGFKNHIWAPDIYFANGLYYLYYSVSAFGKNTSCIGVATNPTLHRNDPAFKWTDHGPLIQSVPGRDMWNAIDPNLAFDQQGTPWLVFGSFWNGIKMVKLNKELLSVATPETWQTVASRPRNQQLNDSMPGDAAIEAPFIWKHDNYYFLFISFDYCCRGEKSNYKVMVGRAETIKGPYMDKQGTPLLQGGGTLVVQGSKDWYGAGHNAVMHDSGYDWLIFHGYDARDKGRSKLRMEKITWDEGWPVIVN